MPSNCEVPATGATLRKFLMSWNSSRQRWQKMFRGEYAYFYPTREGLPATKEGSWQAANAFWRQKQATLANQEKAEHPHAVLIQQVERKEAWAKEHGETAEADRLASTRKGLEQLSQADEPSTQSDSVAANIEAARLFGIEVPSDLDPEIAEHLFGDNRIWQERFKRSAQVAKNATLGHWFDSWLAGQKARAKTGEIAPDRCEGYRSSVNHFVEWLGRGTAVSACSSEATWRNFCNDYVRRKIEAKNWSETTASDVQRHCRMFINHLCEDGAIDAVPRNLKTRPLSIKVHQKKKVHYSIDEVKLIVGKAKPRLRCLLMLMLNCGMTQKDISDLHPSEVDLGAGRITRKRSKTRNTDADAPEVSWLLWDATLALLKEEQCGDKDHWFLTNRGGTYVTKGYKDNGKFGKSDNVASLFRDEKIPGKSLKTFRATSSQVMEDYNSEFATLFLAHNEGQKVRRSTKRKHYADHSETTFDDAIRWLGEQYGFQTSR